MTATAAQEVLWEPHPKQIRFLSSAAFELLGGGQAGGGKSDCIVAAPLRFVHRRTHRALIVRRTFPELQELRDKADALYTPLGGAWSGERKRYEFPSGAFIQFGHAEDGYRTIRRLYHGQSWNDIGVDELTLFDEEKAWTFLLSRIRSTDPTILLQARATTNPGGPGHAWVKRRFVDQCAEDGTPLLVRHKEGLTTTRAFVRFGLRDNPSLTTNDPGYRARLQLLPEMERRQMEEGDWSAGSATYYDEIAPTTHVIPALPEDRIPPHWHRWGGHDWGYMHPWAFCDLLKTDRGELIVRDTVWGRRDSDEVIADTIGTRVPAAKRPDYVIRCGGDVMATQRARRGDATYSTADVYRAQGLTVLRKDDSPGSRRRSAVNLKRVLRYRGLEQARDGTRKDGLPALRFCDTPGNRWLMAQVAAVLRDPTDIELPLKVDWVDGTDTWPEAQDEAPPGDDGVDALTAALSLAVPAVTRPSDLTAAHPDKAPTHQQRKATRDGRDSVASPVVLLPPVTLSAAWDRETDDTYEEVRA